jgi:hypothetical protein
VIKVRYFLTKTELLFPIGHLFIKFACLKKIMLKIFIRITTILLLLLLVSCFDIVEEVTVNNDGSGKISLTINLSKSKTKLNSIMLLDSVNNYKVPSENEVKTHFDKVTASIKKIKGITSVKKQINFNEFIFNITCNFDDINALNAVISHFSSKSDAKKIALNKHFQFNKSKKEFIRNYHYDFNKEFQKINGKDRKVFENAFYTAIYRFESPIVNSKNTVAKLSPNKKAIMLRVSAQDLVSNKKSIKNNIQLQ